MTKQELVDWVCKQQKNITKKTATEITEAIFAAMQHSIKTTERFSFPGFGTFQLRQRKARTGRDPRTGEAIKIKASKTVGFRPAKRFKESLTGVVKAAKSAASTSSAKAKK